MNKKADFVLPGWMIMLILLLVIFGIIIAWLLISYKPELQNFVQANIIKPLG